VDKVGEILNRNKKKVFVIKPSLVE